MSLSRALPPVSHWQAVELRSWSSRFPSALWGRTPTPTGLLRVSPRSHEPSLTCPHTLYFIGHSDPPVSDSTWLLCASLTVRSIAAHVALHRKQPSSIMELSRLLFLSPYLRQNSPRRKEYVLCFLASFSLCQELNRGLMTPCWNSSQCCVYKSTDVWDYGFRTSNSAIWKGLGLAPLPQRISSRFPCVCRELRTCPHLHFSGGKFSNSSCAVLCCERL